MDVYTFPAYSRMKDALTIEEMDRLVGIIEDFCLLHPGDEDFEELYDSVEERSLRYADIRQRWSRMSFGERAVIDDDRTAAHDSLIRAFRILFRYMGSASEEDEKERIFDAWNLLSREDRLGIPSRKRVGDFGCYLAFLAAVHQR